MEGETKTVVRGAGAWGHVEEPGVVGGMENEGL